MKQGARKTAMWVAALLFLAAVVLGGVLYGKAKAGGGAIYLYGEEHSNEKIMEKELELWGGYYESGMRDLFVEYPYSDAQFLNIWMQAEDDTLLEQQFEDWQGTAGGTEAVKNFLKKIKENYPETVFHGTDVGHTFRSTGPRYLAYLEQNGLKDSDEYRRVQENMAQAEEFYATEETDEGAAAYYRENKMVENFRRAYEELEAARKTDIMGIYGAAHVSYSSFLDASAPLYMAAQLKKIYGERVHTEDLTGFTSGELLAEPLSTETVTVKGKTYTAEYFGEVDISEFEGYLSRRYWRLKDAYEDFRQFNRSGETLPYDNYPMEIKEGQVLLVEYLKTDGTTERHYYSADGNSYNGRPTTDGVLVR